MWEGKAVAGIAPEYRFDLGTESAANLWITRDAGKQLSLQGQVRVPRRVFDEHMVVDRRDGSLWTLVRAAYGIGESTSADGGKTWTAGAESAMPHVNSRFFIRRLDSGKLLLVTHNPPDRKTRSHLTAHLSDDDGRTWNAGLMIDERPGVSYPDGVQAPDGSIYLIYDFDRTGAKQILMAKFTEADVAAGVWQSPGSRQRVLVNQATGVRRPQESAPAH